MIISVQVDINARGKKQFLRHEIHYYTGETFISEYTFYVDIISRDF